MKRIFLIAIALLALASSALAVEVTVKTPTKLYDSKGKVLAEVEAGQVFKAEQVANNYVYGFLRTEGGGARGWIALAALDLDEEAKRKLETANTANPSNRSSKTVQPVSDKPVLLRYRLAKDDVQVYETVAGADVTLIASHEGRSVNLPMMRIRGRFVVTRRGTGRADDGSILAAAQIRHMELTIGQMNADTTTWIEKRFDREGMKIYDGRGRLLSTVRYGEGELADAPGVDWLLNNPFEARLTDRNELREMRFTAEGEERSLQFTGMGGQADLKSAIAGAFTYPEKPIKPGDSWEEEVSHELRGKPGVTFPAEVTGRIRYTFERRAMRGDRPTAVITIRGKLYPVQSKEGARFDGVIQGQALIDEATGINISSTVKFIFTVVDPSSKEDAKATVTSTTTQTYKGNKLRE